MSPVYDATGVLTPAALTSAEFGWFTNFLRGCSGIELKPGKESLVMGRLDRRLRHHGLTSYSEYFRLLGRPDAPEETSIAVDLMTTNETYFFREPQHFDLLPSLLPQQVHNSRPLRVWSAASSSGEEAYSIAMTLAECAASVSWEVIGTDLSSQILSVARQGLYPLEESARIPEKLLRAHCLRGRGEHEGYLTVRSELRSRVRFMRANLTRPLPDLGMFDVVFLRNVMIYFNTATKRDVVNRIVDRVRPGGALVIGLAETLTGLEIDLEPVAPSVYRKAAT